MRSMLKAAAAFSLAISVSLAPAARGLTPEQVGVVVNTLSEGSQNIAKHYMEERGIPKGNLLEVTVDPLARGWSEPKYRDMIVAPLRKQLKDKGLENQVTCLVVTYGIPLTVPAAGVAEGDKVEFGAMEKKLRDYADMIDHAGIEYGAIAATTQPATGPAATRRTKVPDPQTLRKAREKLILEADAAVKRIDKLPADLRGPAMQKFADVHRKFLGPAGIVAAITVQEGTPGAAETRRQIERMREELAETKRNVEELSPKANNAKVRQEILALREKSFGIVGASNQAMEYVLRLNPIDSSSCLDSELSLLWHDNYPRARWTQNPYTLEAWPVSRDQKVPKIMMISRLDGLTPQAVIKMIDTGLKVEKEGLTGVCYFDARGIKSAGYEPFDRDLMEAGEYLAKNSSMKVVVDKTETLLKAADCPDAALYCGWYSLRNYQDSCQWKPGSVAYHVASFEMSTLHDEREKGWVSNLLRRDVCGTLGATEEPFLPAFPKPTQFFPLLMSGDFTQGEVFFVTNPWLSWRTGYVGDPLYNPFKAKPAIAAGKIRESGELRRAYEILSALNMGPRK